MPGRRIVINYNDLPLCRWAFADGLRGRTFQFRNNLSAHDAAHVALAETLECPLVTRDARLARSTGHTAQITVY